MAPHAPETRAPVLRADDDPRAAVRAVVAHHLRGLVRAEGTARAGAVEGVHQLRVATRRLRAALRLFGPVLPARLVESCTADLRWLGHCVGRVRDLDVLAAAIAACGARMAPPERPGVAALQRDVAARRREAHHELVALLETPRCRRLLARLQKLAATVPKRRAGEALGARVGALLRPLVRAVQRAGRVVGPDAPAEALHALRVRAKRLRYAVEIVAGLDADTAALVGARLTALQEVLGDHQDAVMQAAWLRREAEAATLATPTLLAAGAVIDRLERRAAKRRALVVRVWQRLDRPKVRRALSALCARRPAAPAPVAPARPATAGAAA